ncbi:protein sprint isoform X2 [Chrysoperla carnea]|uniref:protein sprint isoform X2 n=1 Tax=Chrysoperla carnea TaxID=189513 RepID=UPI001D065E0D|nr:protein sprint isoform X2 [Chrysoperla carnea]
MLPPGNEPTTIVNDNNNTTVRSPNNNNVLTSATQRQLVVAGNRNSVCLSEVVVPVSVGPKRRSWCGVSPNSRRYAEVGNWKHNSRNDAAFLEPYMQGLDGEHLHNNSSNGSPTVGIIGSPAPPPSTRLAPFGLGPLRNSAGDSLDQSRESLSSGGEDGGSADGDSEGGDSTDTGYGAACDIGLVERLIRTHPVWFLPGIQRAGAFHLLQGKEEGNFVVRQSSQPDTMALSVRLPTDKGPYIEHYLIQSSNGRLGLETSENRFNDIPSLIAYYSQCCDELPVQLVLPRAIREAPTRQQLSSLALLGQEFWRYPMANPRPPDRSQDNSSSVPANSDTSISSPDSGDNVLLTLNPIMTTFKGNLSNNNNNDTTIANNGLINTQQSNGVIPARGPRPTPPNTLNIVSNTALLTRSNTASPQSVVIEGSTTKTPPPPPPRWAKPLKTSDSSSVVSSSNSPQSQNSNFTVTTTVTFSVNNTPANVVEQDGGITHSPSHVEISCDPSKRLSPEGQCISTISSQGSIRRTSIIKSHRSNSPATTTPSQILSPSNSDATTTTFSTSSSSHHHHHQQIIQQQTSQVLSPTTSTVLSPVGSVLSPVGSVLSPQTGSGPPSLLSPATPDTVSPLSVSRASGRHSKRSKPGRKISRHYQESDILDSPTVYYRSSVGDKISDYEDIWGPDHSTCSTFKPKISPFASPDLIQHTGNVISLHNNILSPSGSQQESSSQSSFSPQENQHSTQCEIKNRLNLVMPNRTNSPSFKDTSPSPRIDSPTPKPKQGSPFYAEPADSIAQAAVIRRQQIRGPLNLSQRHSNPSSFHIKLESQILEENRLENVDLVSSPVSTSVDNLTCVNKGAKFNLIGNCRRSGAKPVQPPIIKQYLQGVKQDPSWTLDNSWQFIGNESDDSYIEDSDWAQPFPPLPLISPHTPESPGEKQTVHQVIAHRFPELNLVTNHHQHTSHNQDSNGCRMSSYDNVEGRNHPAPPSEISEPCTIFSEPWTETSWQPQNNHTPRISGIQNDMNEDEDKSMDSQGLPYDNGLNRGKSFRDRLDPLLSPPRVMALRNRESGAAGAGIAIRNYALALAQDKTTTFAQQIENFISCTRESRETNPQVVMRNMRQFMSGMKNYLVKHGERGFEREVEKERSKLKSTEFLNLDAILEGVLHRLVVRPLRSHLQSLFVEFYTRTGAIKLLADNIQYANTRPLSELAIRPKICLPSENDLETISQFITRLQDADSPLEKLENLLAAIATIFHSVKCSNSRSPLTLGADDFLPLFVWVLVKTNFIAAEIEAEYMWGLLHPSLLSGEGGYYLTTLSSAVHVLKNFKASHEENSENENKVNTDYPPVLKVVVPDERHGSILTKTLPVRPHMTTKQICKIIAHKSRITNPQDYALYRLIDGEETMLADNECPQEVTGEQKHGMLVYKRTDAKIAWPKSNSPQK